MGNQLGRRLLLLAVLLLAFALRLHRLEAQSFWNDEGNSARLSERPIPLIIEGTASDVHPPLYYLLLRGWREGVGETEFGLRAFSLFVGLGTVAVTMALGKRLYPVGRGKGSNWGMLLAGLVTAVSPPLIYYSQETRMYALLAFLAVLSTWLLRLAIDDLRLTIDDLRLTIGYALVVTAGLYTHYFFPAVVLGHGLYVGGLAGYAWFRSRPRTRLPLRLFGFWLLAVAAAGLAYLPWLPIFWRQTGGRVGGGGSPVAFLREAGGWLVGGETLPAAQVVWPLWAALALLLLAVMRQRAHARRRAHLLLPLLLLLTPLTFMFASGATQPQYFKFLGVTVPFLALLMVGGVAPWRRGVDGALAVLLLLVVLWGSGRSLHNLYANPAYVRADYRGIAARIVAENHPNAGIILDAPNQWEVFTYYYADAQRVYPLPLGQPQPERLATQLADIAARHDRLYAIFWGEAQRDPERLVERWLDEHAFKATDEWYQDVRFVTYAVPAVAATEMETVTAVPFGPHIILNGYTVRDTTLLPGDIIQITLFWQTDAPLQQRYKIFLHLVDEDGGLPVAQRDSEPGGGLNLTTIWTPGEVVIDNHGILIPADTPPGQYTLLLGLYDIADATARLPIATAVGVVDALPLAEVVVR
ncbi:MAG: glycosyltransferase family 39 protein [Anaerolinea sp.]|nr:glycosyltransferase family 39 protein [Anaerolinea sp.]